MARYSEPYMMEHCIDVFFLYRNRPMHILTDGNFIPEQLNDRGANRTTQQALAMLMPDEITLNNIRIEQSYINSLNNLAIADMPFPQPEVLLRMFAPMAQLGFYSYDCVETLPEGRGRYVLVASPDYPDRHDIPEPEVEIPTYDGIEIVMEENDVIKSFIM